MEDYSDLADFKNLLKPILIPRMPDTPGNTQVRNVSRALKLVKDKDWFALIVHVCICIFFEEVDRFSLCSDEGYIKCP